MLPSHKTRSIRGQRILERTPKRSKHKREKPRRNRHKRCSYCRLYWQEPRKNLERASLKKQQKTPHHEILYSRNVSRLVPYVRTNIQGQRRPTNCDRQGKGRCVCFPANAPRPCTQIHKVGNKISPKRPPSLSHSLVKASFSSDTYPTCVSCYRLNAGENKIRSPTRCQHNRPTPGLLYNTRQQPDEDTGSKQFRTCPRRILAVMPGTPGRSLHWVHLRHERKGRGVRTGRQTNIKLELVLRP